MSLDAFTQMGKSSPTSRSSRTLTYYDKINLMPKQRSRDISLSLDWANIIKDTENEKQRRQAQVYLSGQVYDKEPVQFCTGSSYSGKWNALGMTVYGQYIYPQGCEYEGGIEDGRFHGEGTLSYPMGQKLNGVWYKGKLMSYEFTNIDGLEYNDSWNYCKFPDRRFNVSLREGLQPAGREHLTNQQPTRELPPGMYDTGDGFYNPKMQAIILSRDPQEYEQLEDHDSVEIISPSEDDDDMFWMQAINMIRPDRVKWIEQNYRKGWDAPTGYRPDLYPDWITGRNKELQEMEIECNPPEEPPESVDVSSDKESPSEQTGPSLSIPFMEYAGTGRKLTGSKSDLCLSIPVKTLLE